MEKNLPFLNDHNTYGESDEKVKELMMKAEEDRKILKEKYKVFLPEGALNHDKKFKPASLRKSVFL